LILLARKKFLDVGSMVYGEPSRRQCSAASSPIETQTIQSFLSDISLLSDLRCHGINEIPQKIAARIFTASRRDPTVELVVDCGLAAGRSGGVGRIAELPGQNDPLQFFS